MSIQDCPACGTGEITFHVEQDWQGDGVWQTPIWLIEIDEQTCACELTHAHYEHLDEMAANATAWERD
jgi:hypothetical protein